MKNNRKLLAVLATALLVTQPMMAVDQPKAPTPILRRECTALKDAYYHARSEGIRACSGAEKIRLFIIPTILGFTFYWMRGGFATGWLVEESPGQCTGAREKEQQVQNENPQNEKIEHMVKVLESPEFAEAVKRWTSPEHAQQQLNSKLSAAVLRGDVVGIGEAIDAGAQVNVKGKTGCAPLHWAVRGMRKDPVKGRETVERLLKVEGINVNVPDEKGCTPLDFAFERLRSQDQPALVSGIFDLIVLLRKVGAQTSKDLIKVPSKRNDVSGLLSKYLKSEEL